MQAEANIHRSLNQVLRRELTLINQHFLHARMLKNWGYQGLGDTIYRQSILVMKHADVLIERIFFLEGLPSFKSFSKLLIGKDIDEVLSCERKAVLEQHATQRATIADLEAVQDYVSRNILDGQLSDTEHYLDWLEEQIEQIEEIGLANFLQSAIAS